MTGHFCKLSACVKSISLGHRPADCFRRCPSYNSVMINDLRTHREGECKMFKRSERGVNAYVDGR